AWEERRALTCQEAPLFVDGEAPQRARGFVALPLGSEGLVYLEDAWLPTDPRGAERESLAAAASRWADSVAGSRVEQRRVLRQRIQESMGQVIFALLPEDEGGDPWPSSVKTLESMLEADAV